VAGIAGILGGNDAVLNTLLQRIKHRGPDNTWTYRNDTLRLGCNELNVGANCPDNSHYTADGTRAVAMDGRIYNKAKSDITDADAVLESYTRHGIDFAETIDGDFACAICDDGQLILARDRTGIKPLYYGHDVRNDLYFASEAKALVNISSDVREFPPGYTYSREQGFRPFRMEAVETPDFENYEQAKGVVRQLLMEATEKRMQDSAVTGIFLSGGLDSSLIAFMAKEISPDIECYTVSMENGQDLPLARDVTEYLGLTHHILMFDEKEIHEILPTAIHHQEMYEESCVHGAIANFLAGRFVKNRCRCVLTGEGADEFFAGYDGQFRQGNNPEEIAYIVDNLINVAHNTALQRLDRLNAAHAVESRTPFLDSRVMSFALKIPLEHKIYGPDMIGKWILREAFAECLPNHLIFQTKRFFAQGAGVAHIMRTEAERVVSQKELAEFNMIDDNPYLSSVEELYYYRMFKKTLPHPSYDRLVGRWDPSRPAFFSEWQHPSF